MLEFYILGDMGSGESSQYIVSNALKQHIENTSSIDADSGAVMIVTNKKAPKDHPDYPGFIRVKIADDTWRTAGTSQKVASGFGQDMRDCIIKAADKDRNK